MEDIIALVLGLGVMFVGLAISLGLAYATGRLAANKGYSFWLGFIGGIIAWLPTLIILLVIQPKVETAVVSSSLPLQSVGFGGQKTCPLCKNVNLAQTTSCLRCGMAFAASIESSTGDMNMSVNVHPEVAEGRTRICPRCGDVNNPSRATCKTCGAEFAV